MKNKLIYPIVVVVFAAACGGDGEGGKRVAGQEYETVQEGSAAGVTSSIAGPGETLPPITNTNADTTSAFALNPNAAPMSAQPGQPPATMAGTMPPPAQPAYNGGTPSYNPPPRTASQAPTPAPAPQRQTYVPPPMTSSTRPAPAPQPAPEPQQTETAAGPAPNTDSSATTTAPPPQTNTAPPPAEKPKQEEQQQEDPAEDNAEPAEEPPPPPPPAV
jgi:hypothetical protein